MSESLALSLPDVLSKGGQLAPLKNVDPKEILQRYLAEETGAQIAETYGVTRAALSYFMLKHAENEWKDAQVTKALQRKERAEDLLETADNALDLTRAREQLRSAQWDLERVCRRIYGQDAPPATAAVQINIGIRREPATNAVQHETLVVEADKGGA
jgi:hypothetical protein